MAAISDIPFVHHDEPLTSAPRLLPEVSEPHDPEAGAIELRQAFCAQLKAARERRGVRLQKIAEATKVSVSLYTDLERCNVARWPTGIYRRAFFREYVVAVGLPVESTLAEFTRLFPEDLEHATTETLVPGPLRLTLARPFWRQLSPLHGVAALIDLTLIAFGVFALLRLTSASVGVATAIVAILYHVAGTAFRGCSLGAWLVRTRKRRLRSKAPWVMLALLSLAAPAAAQTQSTFKPEVGQAGKDVVWVPTPEAMVERMLDLAKVTPQDYVIDLGSGDGRNVIAAAKRGANALGVEYNPDMVALSKRLASDAGVSSKAQFVQGDMFLADISKADVMALFLLPSNLLRLRDKFYQLRPGSRIVSNTFSIQDWEADETVTLDNCEQWCTAMLYIVPAKIGGTWRVGSDVLELKQEFQMLSGTWTSGGQSTPVFGFLKGFDMTLKAGTKAVSGRVDGNSINGSLTDGSAKSSWRATR
jgi:SAM-dependent methyltransferase/transcriptional regulator with XRE-family HTH domain